MTRTLEELQQQTLKAKVSGIENAWILCSAKPRTDEDDYGIPQVKATMSFLYDAGNVAAEWEPEYGPITHSLLQRRDYVDRKLKPHQRDEW